jgi:hypothetical protein
MWGYSLLFIRILHLAQRKLRPIFVVSAYLSDEPSISKLATMHYF